MWAFLTSKFIRFCLWISVWSACAGGFAFTYLSLSDIPKHTQAFRIQVALLVLEVLIILSPTYYYLFRCIFDRCIYPLIKPNDFALVQIACRNANPHWYQGQRIDIKGPKEFTFFRKLPLELQLRIWEIAVQDYPATVWYLPPGEYKGPDPAQRLRQFLLREKLFHIQADPYLLQVSSDARKMAKKYYELSFDILHPRNGVYFDFAKDALCMSDISTLKGFSHMQHMQAGPAPRDTDRVTKFWYVTKLSDGDESVAEMCTLFTGVKEINIIDGGSAWYYSGVSNTVKEVSMAQMSQKFQRDMQAFILDGQQRMNYDIDKWRAPVVRVGLWNEWEKRAGELLMEG